jgi:hypothetical protein
MKRNNQNYLFYGAPGVIVLIVSIMASLKVGADFDNDPMVRIGVFLVCGTLLWGVYEYVCQPVAVGLCSFITNAVQYNNSVAAQHQSISEAPQSINKELVISPSQPSNDLPSNSSIPSISASYSDRNAEYANEQAVKKAARLTAIDGYIDYWMPPFIHEADMSRLHDEFCRWADNPEYIPTEGIEPKSQLSTYDLRHFVWSIAERLNTYGGYDGETRARFIKALFPKPLKDIEVSSLKNMRTKTNSDIIPIDVPEPDKIDFHYPKDEEKHAT